MRNQLKIVLISAALAYSSGACADYFIVVNDTNPQVSLTRKEVLHLFMGRTRAFPNGNSAQTLDMQGDNRKRAGFYLALSGMSLGQVNSYWARLMFSGQNLPPRPTPDDASMIDSIKRNPQAIGWLSSLPTDKGLRTVLVLKE
jgi:hypothetical protein